MDDDLHERMYGELVAVLDRADDMHEADKVVVLASVLTDLVGSRPHRELGVALCITLLESIPGLDMGEVQRIRG